MGASSARKFNFNQSGAAVLITVMALTTIAGLTLTIFMFNREQSLLSARQAAAPAIQASVVKSAIETFMLAWRAAEQKYYRRLDGCTAANSFMTALVAGSGCDSASVTVFDSSSATTDPFDGGNTYSYEPSAAGCTILPNSSNCGAYKTVFLTMRNADQKIQGYTFEFSLANIYQSSRMAEIRIEITEAKGKHAAPMIFALRDNFVNLVHMQSDGTVIQERPDPLAKCPNNAWGPYRVFLGNTCRTFSLLGSGTGLASYNNRYFGFRSASGIFVDMAALTNGGIPSSYVVQPNGSVNGVANIFVPYPDPDDPVNLRNVDDVTLIDKQIYYVKGSGMGNVLGVVGGTPGAYTLNTVCPIGQSSWAQALNGLATQASSEPLVPITGDLLTSTRHATFYEKTDGGDFLVTKVWSDAPNVYKCITFKDPSLIEIEHKRTLGFDRSVPEKIYFLY